MDEEKQKAESLPSESARPLRGKEKFYEHFRGVPLKALDIFIGLCIAAFFLVIAVGVLQGGKFG